MLAIVGSLTTFCKSHDGQQSNLAGAHSDEKSSDEANVSPSVAVENEEHESMIQERLAEEAHSPAADNVVSAAVSGGEYVFKSKSTGKCLDVSGNAKGNGARVIAWPCNNAANQTWVRYGGGPRWTFKSKSAGKCLDLVGGKGGPIVIWDCHGRANQFIAPQGHYNGGVRLQANIGYDACIDINRKGEVVHNTCHAGPGMRFDEIRK